MNTSSQIQNENEELSITDLINFFKKYWVSLIATSAAGLILALTYSFLITPVYESRLQIEMARTNGSNTGPNADAHGIPIEEAQLLVERLRLPSTYSPKTLSVCLAKNTLVSTDRLLRTITARPVKNVKAVVELAARGSSPEKSKACAESLFEMVREQQNQLLLPLLQETREDIRSMRARLAVNQEFLSSMEKTDIQSAVYLARRDESLWLMNEITLLERSLRQTSETRLISPIYTADEPVSPHITIAVIAGILGGLFLGIMWAWIRFQLEKRTRKA